MIPVNPSHVARYVPSKIVHISGTDTKIKMNIITDIPPSIINQSFIFISSPFYVH